MSELFRFWFWRLLRRPQVGDVWWYRDSAPWDAGPTEVEVVEVHDNWARICYSCGVTRGIYLRSLLAFYKLKTKEPA